MRKKIIFIDFLIMIILLFSIVFMYISIINMNEMGFVLFLFLGIILFFYSIIKSVLGIILFIKNILQKNIIISPKGILLLSIPFLVLGLIIYIGHFLFYRLFQGWYISLEMMMATIILIIGCLTLLCYYLLNKTLIIKIYYKIILAIIIPVSYFIGYWITMDYILKHQL